MIRGIYGVFNLTNGWVYVGCSKNVETRCRWHFKALAKDSHPLKDLQRDWNLNHEFHVAFLQRRLSLKSEGLWIRSFEHVYNFSNRDPSYARRVDTKKQRNPVNKEVSHLAKLTADNVRFIRKAWKTRKATEVVLAKQFKVSQAAICHLLQRKTYKYVV